MDVVASKDVKVEDEAKTWTFEVEVSRLRKEVETDGDVGASAASVPTPSSPVQTMDRQIDNGLARQLPLDSLSATTPRCSRKPQPDEGLWAKEKIPLVEHPAGEVEVLPQLPHPTAVEVAAPSLSRSHQDEGYARLSPPRFDVKSPKPLEQRLDIQTLVKGQTIKLEKDKIKREEEEKEINLIELTPSPPRHKSKRGEKLTYDNVVKEEVKEH
ncbi:uncharacterized protein PAC_08472 [Phialocephala subalpina]|uniref:Uncharacterized protein n=1 Tax=Phialocephala subalpina TaxID=576137 RepID=A0A1L7X0Q0_9HELO|nr:uncharacterized protein PAC_08472 [Phialocephala subalpina]